MSNALQIVKVATVILLVVFAAILATPPGRLPLAVRGLAKIFRRDRGIDSTAETAAPVWKRLLAFLLVLVAAAVALSF